MQLHALANQRYGVGLELARQYAAKNWNPQIAMPDNLYRYKFENYIKEIFVDSETDVVLLSGAPFDDPSWDFLSNAQMTQAREMVSTVSNWVNDFQQRKRVETRQAFENLFSAQPKASEV